MDKALQYLDFTKLIWNPNFSKFYAIAESYWDFDNRVEWGKRREQALRDEIARLKGGKGKPEIKANRTDNEEDGDNEDEDQKKSKQRKHGSGKNSKNRKPRNKRITIDREETVKLDRSELPDDVTVRGYREVTIQNIKFETDNVLYRLEILYSPSTGKYYEADLPEGRTGQSYGSDLEAFVLMLYFQLRVTQIKSVNFSTRLVLSFQKDKYRMSSSRNIWETFQKNAKKSSEQDWKQASITKLTIQGQEKMG